MTHPAGLTAPWPQSDSVLECIAVLVAAGASPRARADNRKLPHECVSEEAFKPVFEAMRTAYMDARFKRKAAREKKKAKARGKAV